MDKGRTLQVNRKFIFFFLQTVEIIAMLSLFYLQLCIILGFSQNSNREQKHFLLLVSVFSDL